MSLNPKPGELEADPVQAVSWFDWVWRDMRQFRLFCVSYSTFFAVAAGLLALVIHRDQSNDLQPRVQYLYLHGATQFICWGVLIPIGAMLPLFFRHVKGWLEWHLFLMGCVTLAQIPAGILAYQCYSGVNDTSLKWSLTNIPHADYGVTLFVLTFAQASLGQVVNGGPSLPCTQISLSRWYRVPAHVLGVCAQGHRLLGKLVLLGAFGNLLLGSWTLSVYDNYLTHFGTTGATVFIAMVAVWIGAIGVVYGMIFGSKYKKRLAGEVMEAEVRYSYGEVHAMSAGFDENNDPLEQSSASGLQLECPHVYHLWSGTFSEPQGHGANPGLQINGQ